LSEKLCLQCGTVGQTERLIYGSVLLEILLWCFLLIPGLIYSSWRNSTRRQVCRKCGSRNIIPIESPVAMKMLEETQIGQQVMEKSRPKTAEEVQRAHPIARDAGASLSRAVRCLKAPTSSRPAA
jgi:hypothetical protein